MFWFLVVLIVAGISYAIYDIKDYQIGVEDGKNRIKVLESRADKFERTVAQEQKKNREANDPLALCRETESELKNEITLRGAQVQSAQKQEAELEMNMYKQEFKKSKQRKY